MQMQKIANSTADLNRYAKCHKISKGVTKNAGFLWDIILHFSPWINYWTGTGWINGVALMGQEQEDNKERKRKQNELWEKLQDKYEKDLAKKYKLTREQLNEIFSEGIRKD